MLARFPFLEIRLSFLELWFSFLEVRSWLALEIRTRTMTWSRVASWARSILSPVLLLRILSVDVVNISIAAPADRAIEVVSILVSLPLLGGEHSLELLVAILPTVGVDVTIAADAIEVGEVDIQDIVALNVAQSQFYYHLVGDEASLCLYVGQSLSVC